MDTILSQYDNFITHPMFIILFNEHNAMIMCLLVFSQGALVRSTRCMFINNLLTFNTGIVSGLVYAGVSHHYHS